MRRKEKQANIGIFAIGLDAYWAQFPGLEDGILKNFNHLCKKFKKEYHLISAGLVDSYKKACEGNQRFEREQPDMIFCYCATYSPSSNVLPVLKGLEVPVIVLNLQPVEEIEYSKCNQIGEWLSSLSCAGAPEVTAVLLKRKLRYAVITGYLKGDAQADRELEEWCQVAEVLHQLNHERIGLFGHAFPGMMDLYVDETKLYNQLGVFTEFLELHEIKNRLPKVQEDQMAYVRLLIKDIFEIQVAEDTSEFEDLCRSCAALYELVKEEELDGIALHYAGETMGEYKDLIAPMNIIFSVLMSLGIPCCVEGDVKTTAAMEILKCLSGCCATAELYSMDFKEDICLIGHSGSSDPALSDRKPVLKESEVFHGKSGKGYLTQFIVKAGPVTLLALSEDGEGNYRFITAAGNSEPGEILMLGDTNTRVRFPMPLRDFVNQWCMAGPSHHFALTLGNHVEMIKKLGRVLEMEVIEIK